MINQESVLHWLYQTRVGRGILTVLIRPSVSRLVGKFLDTPVSTVLNRGFIKSNHIDMKEYEQRKYKSFNDLFTRKVRPECRPIPTNEEELFSPCDSRLLVYQIREDSQFQIKGTKYSFCDLVRSEKLAKRYESGTFLLFRLSVDDYHRYCYIDDGKKSCNYHIPGVFHTVNPIANEEVPIYKENTREFSLLKSKHFGTVLMMEVGAMLVGRIVNLDGQTTVKRGQEKGYFEYGGSTVILCFQKDKVKVEDIYWKNSEQGIETKVKMGQKIGAVNHTMI